MVVVIKRHLIFTLHPKLVPAVRTILVNLLNQDKVVSQDITRLGKASREGLQRAPETERLRKCLLQVFHKTKLTQVTNL